MRTFNFAKRSFKEIARDPLSIIFAILLPLFLLIIFRQFKIPNAVYDIENFTPATIIFSFSFVTLFTAVLVANDACTSLLTRLCASPMKTGDYIFGYILSVLPVVLLQNVLFFSAGFFLGLKVDAAVFAAMAVSIPLSLVFILLGIMIGSISGEKSASGISSVVVQLVAFTSGMYFPAEMIGKGFDVVCKILPFSHCLNIIKGILNKNCDGLLLSAIVVTAYIFVIGILTFILFKRRMQSDNK